MDAEAQQTRSLRLSGGATWPRRLLAASGPGYVIAVGYMDPGNWATDLAGGSAYGYRLLSVVLASSIMAMLLQAWSARLGLVTGRDLAQSCAQALPRIPRIALWATAELGIIACDLAEVIGTAIALKLLFGLPLLVGAIITIVDVIIVLALLGRGMRGLEAFVIALIITVMLCFAIQMALAQPSRGQTQRGRAQLPLPFGSSASQRRSRIGLALHFSRLTQPDERYLRVTPCFG